MMTEADLLELALDVTRMTKERWSELLDVLKSDSAMNAIMRAEWNAKPRDSEEAIREYYRSSNIWFVNTWNHGVGALLKLLQISSVGTPAMWKAAECQQGFYQPFTNFGITSWILDYGGGFWNDTWPLVAAGYRVAQAEVKGPTTTFLKLFRDLAGLEDWIDVVEVDSDCPIKAMYEGIICFETLEHLDDPVAFMRHLVEHLHNGKPLAYSASFGATPHAPYHVAHNAPLAHGWAEVLSRFGLSPYWLAPDKHRQIWKKEIAG